MLHLDQSSLDFVVTQLECVMAMLDGWSQLASSPVPPCLVSRLAVSELFNPPFKVGQTSLICLEGGYRLIVIKCMAA